MRPPPASSPRSGSQSGAFDLPSVLIGVAVVAILAIGVMATIFGVIPWAQDRAAKQDLAAMNTAQGTAYARDGSFTDKAALVAAGWLGEGTPAALDAKADVEGKCYVAVTTSKTGNQFVVSHDKPTPRELTASDTWCTGAPIIKDTAPVMITTWDTSLADGCREITLPVAGLKGTVGWGDGTKNTETTHTFTASGPVTVRIDGNFPSWGGEGWADAGCLISVDRWGDTETSNLTGAFWNADNLQHVASLPPSVTDLTSAFQEVGSNPTLGAFDTSGVRSMRCMFCMTAGFNQPVDFDTSRVTTFRSMFYEAASFNQPLNFDTSQASSMRTMFYRAAKFNQPLNFDTSKVTDMEGMLSEATIFDQPLDFDTSQVTSMDSMFSNAALFDQPLEFDTGEVTDMGHMFQDAASFNQPLNFDTSKVTRMYAMFDGADSFNQDLSGWNVELVTNRDFFIDWGRFPESKAPKFR